MRQFQSEVPPQTIRVGSLEREYRVVAPKEVPKTAMPMVFVFHGGTMRNGSVNMVRQSGFAEIALKEGLVAVFPQGVDGHWNDGRNAEIFRSLIARGVDDVAFVRQLVETLAKRYPIDTTRLYAVGVSNGGIFCHRLAHEASDLIVAIAPIIASMPDTLAPKFAPKYPVSAIIFQGDADRLIPYNGGYVGVMGGRRGKVIPAEETVRHYLRLNGISGAPEVVILPDKDPSDGTITEVHRYPPGKEGHRVEYYRVRGGGHCWFGRMPQDPRSGKTSLDFSATEAAWRFFKQVPPRRR
ncbi:MAG: PHB depolymerase family esterase [Fimbriimonadales bacterium]